MSAQLSHTIFHDKDRMAPIVQKRARLQDQRGSRKRQRVGIPRDALAAQKIRDVGVSPLDELAWKTVALPDRLDDAEGFFGLEEIEDVEVVKDEKNGRIEYRVGKISQYTISEKHSLILQSQQPILGKTTGSPI